MGLCTIGTNKNIHLLFESNNNAPSDTQLRVIIDGAFDFILRPFLFGLLMTWKVMFCTNIPRELMLFCHYRRKLRHVSMHLYRCSNLPCQSLPLPDLGQG